MAWLQILKDLHVTLLDLKYECSDIGPYIWLLWPEMFGELMVINWKLWFLFFKYDPVQYCCIQAWQNWAFSWSETLLGPHGFCQSQSSIRWPNSSLMFMIWLRCRWVWDNANKFDTMQSNERLYFVQVLNPIQHQSYWLNVTSTLV